MRVYESCILVLEESTRKLDVIESTSDGPFRLGLHIWFHTYNAVVRHLFGQILKEKKSR